LHAHHYCSHINEEVHQCVIYESDKANARLIGIEYIITEKLFNQLPEDEKKYWHSHIHEVKSGILVAPEVPDAAEHEVMKTLISTYGKTVHTWQVDRGDPLPYGPPQLMFSYSDDSQVDWDYLRKRDSEEGYYSQGKRQLRADIKEPRKARGADDWESGKTVQYQAVAIDNKMVGHKQIQSDDL